MTEGDDIESQRWRDTLAPDELAQVEDTLRRNPELEDELVAMLEGLSPRRRAAFVRAFAANLDTASSAETALMLALADLRIGGDVRGGVEN